MIKFIARRLFYGILILFGVEVVVFLLFHALPGDPVAMLAGQRSDIATRNEIADELGLNKPLFKQFLLYLNDQSIISVHQDTDENAQKYAYKPLFNYEKDYVVVLKFPYLRRSFQSNKKVTEIIHENIESTFWLAFAALFIAIIIGIPFGVGAALNQNTVLDQALISLSVVGISVPSFVAAVVISLLFGYYLSDYTGLNLTGQLWVVHPIRGKELHLENIILPAITLGIRPLAVIVQLTRSSMLDVLTQDYIRTAKAKGLSKFAIIFKHALKNALNPVVTAVSGWLATLMAGAFFVEYIFDWKGIGFITIKAVQNLDFPVVIGCTLFIASIFIVINIMVDVMYALLDPKVRLK